MADPTSPLTDPDYAALADFRHALRLFHAFSEASAAQQGLTPQQHQALLAIRAAGSGPPTIGDVARRLMLKPHRSEEHTSELQSLMRISYAVFCLKKKKDNDTTNY